MKTICLSLLIAYLCTLSYYHISYNIENFKVNKKADKITELMMSVLTLYFYFTDITDKGVIVCQKYIDKLLRQFDLYDEIIEYKISRIDNLSLNVSFSIKSNDIFNYRTIEFIRNDTAIKNNVDENND